MEECATPWGWDWPLDLDSGSSSAMPSLGAMSSDSLGISSNESHYHDHSGVRLQALRLDHRAARCITSPSTRQVNSTSSSVSVGWQRNINAVSPNRLATGSGRSGIHPLPSKAFSR